MSWDCPNCGPVEDVLHGSDEKLHCLECDAGVLGFDGRAEATVLSKVGARSRCFVDSSRRLTHYRSGTQALLLRGTPSRHVARKDQSDPYDQARRDEFGDEWMGPHARWVVEEQERQRARWRAWRSGA